MPRGKYTPFTPQQLQFIQDNYLIMPVKILGKQVNASHGRIMNHLQRNNMHLPADLIEQRKRDSHLKKGHVPFNKGKKITDFLSSESIESHKKTRFKKGNIPHNTNKHGDGAITMRADGYRYIRIKKGVWVLYHRWLWEQYNGPIPPDAIVVFKDGHPSNTVIHNLELQCRVENMLRNTKYKLPDELIPSQVLVNKINNKIKKLNHG